MIRGLHHVAINCRDIDKMLAFYKEAFGFEQVFQHEWRDSPVMDQIIDVPGSASRIAMMRFSNCYIELFQYSAPDPVSTRPLRPFDKGYTHFCIEVTEIEKEYERLRGLGMTFGHPSPIEVGGAKAIYGRDPEGNIIEIQESGVPSPIDVDKLPKASI
jgi:catechol 2,3-dioxygenase-like lactoylglutathione lyase family enzyme